MKRLVLTLVLAGGLASPVSGQVVFGPQGSWGDESDFGIGARLQVPFAGLVTTEPGSALSTMFLIGSFDWFFPDDDDFPGVDVNWFEVNLNAAYPLVMEGLRPYVGAGLNYARVSVEVGGETDSDSDVGLNVLGGLNFLLGGLTAFTEGRFELGGGEQFVLTFGVLFGGS